MDVPGRDATRTTRLLAIERLFDYRRGMSTVPGPPPGAQRAGAAARVRPARLDELAHLQAVEVAAGELFRPLGMLRVADDDPPPLDFLAAVAGAGRAFVAEGPDGRPVGYLLLDVVDDAGHVEQVSVHPDHGRRGLGRALLATAETWARERDLGALTLTTYADVPWNAPLYSRLGYRILRGHEQGPQLRALRRQETATGLDAWPRVAMRRVLDPPGAGTAWPFPAERPPGPCGTLRP